MPPLDPDHYVVRKLWPLDFPAFRRHLKRLDPETRELRFGRPVNDTFLDAHAGTAGELGTLIYGAFDGREIHAAAELRPLPPGQGPIAEAAFTVEKHIQHHGLGTRLMDRILTAAQNRGISELWMICLRENGSMRSLAGKFGARLEVEEGKVTGHIAPAFPTPMSLFDETWHEAQALMSAALDPRSYPLIAMPGTQA